MCGVLDVLRDSNVIKRAHFLVKSQKEQYIYTMKHFAFLIAFMRCFFLETPVVDAAN
jgi:hypothetical protein